MDEGDLVKPGQVLVRLDTVTIEAEQAKNEAAVAGAREEFAAAKGAIATANADIATANAETAGANADIAAANADIVAANAATERQQSEIQLAQTEADRQRRMLAENATSQGLFDIRQTALETSKTTLKSAQAQAEAAQARADAAQATGGRRKSKGGCRGSTGGTAQAQADAAQRQIEVAQAQVEVTKSRIKDATLISPMTGRVLYRLVEAGEVLGPGGKALTIVDLSDVYMEIFLPSEQAAAVENRRACAHHRRLRTGQIRCGYVSFVSPEAQFTPKQVETKSEREKLMFRVKIQIPAELVTHYIEQIKTGVRGVGYVKVSPDAKFPQWLENGLINPPTNKSALESSHSLGTPN